MADLTIDAAAVAPVQVNETSQMIGVAGQAIDAGQYVSRDSASGQFVPGGTGGGIALNGASVGMELTVQREGIIDLGDALDGLSFGQPVYIGAGGALADDDGAGANEAAGSVEAAYGTIPAGKLLRLERR